MDAIAGPCTGPSIAIIGGGVTGTALALHLADSLPGCRLIIFEPRPLIGPGLAYSTADPAHRLNAPAQRMSLYPDDPEHFSAWIAATGACGNDTGAALADGRLFPRRAVFGAYAAAQIAPLLQSGRLIHHREAAKDLTWQHGAWTICSGESTHRANIVILATGLPPPAIPSALAPVAAAANFVANPLRPGALVGISPKANVLILGTGLTMADIAASLDAAGHSGPIHAISRRGLPPRPHAGPCAPCGDFSAPPVSARALVAQIRVTVAAAVAGGKPWQSVFDALRQSAQPLWQALPAVEKSRLIRHARPFWESHRHRLPPATSAVLGRRLGDQSLTIAAASITASRCAGERIAVTIQPRGNTQPIETVFDAVILATGPGRITDTQSGLIANLMKSGLIAVDDTGLGLTCNTHALFLAGPITRGAIGEITAVPELTRQAASLAQQIAAFARIVHK